MNFTTLNKNMKLSRKVTTQEFVQTIRQRLATGQKVTVRYGAIDGYFLIFKEDENTSVMHPSRQDFMWFLEQINAKETMEEIDDETAKGGNPCIESTLYTLDNRLN
ncbi:hypothetical protein F1C16_05060 [Hymenobacter sp. NBH84]|uniref:hypothetical protein n=1 Tax=Hymenobacter sp. NBH84 TaxID=2596915 RepID=UPI001626C9C7|nr:hypothetical protein [Hymenobacter sp. NBH84]QNE38965.1 hypothetical protein F1C16_05060 [Hymenobacter sp. NBH84]